MVPYSPVAHTYINIPYTAIIFNTDEALNYLLYAIYVAHTPVPFTIFVGYVRPHIREQWFIYLFIYFLLLLIYMFTSF